MSTLRAEHRRNARAEHHHDHVEQDDEPDVPAPGERYRLNRDRRLHLRRVLGKLTTKDRCKTCGALPVGEGGTATVVRGEVEGVGTVAGVAGVGRCRMVNLCPWCGAFAREERAREVEHYTARHLRAGGVVWFGAFTLASQPGEAVEDATTLVQTCWSELWSGRWAQDFKQRYRLIGTVRAFEWTIRLDGSGHPHVHPLFFLAGTLDVAEQAQFYGELILRWRAICAAHGRHVDAAHGVQLTPVVLDDHGRTVGMGDYFTKAGAWGIGRELARVDVKRARRNGSLSPWELLAYFAETGDVDARGAWQAYERAAAGKAAVYWPRGLRAKLDGYAAGVTAPTGHDDELDVPERCDEPGADEDAEARTFAGSRPVLTLNYTAWRWFHGLHMDGLLLRVVELAGTDDDVPELVHTLARRLRAPGAVLAGIIGP